MILFLLKWSEKLTRLILKAEWLPFSEGLGSTVAYAQEHLGLPTTWQMEEQPHAHSGLKSLLNGAKQNTNPQDGQSFYAALLSMNVQSWTQGFPRLRPMKPHSHVSL